MQKRGCNKRVVFFEVFEFSRVKNEDRVQTANVGKMFSRELLFDLVVVCRTFEKVLCHRTFLNCAWLFCDVSEGRVLRTPSPPLRRRASSLCRKRFTKEA